MITLVLLPGMDGTGTLFKPFVEMLGLRFNVKVVRYPTTEPMGYSELESYARAQLPTEGPFVILGESFSGPVAIALAASCSSQLKGLILCCSFARNPYPFFSGFKSLVEAFPVSIVPKSVLSHFLLDPFATDTLRLALSQAIAQVSPSAFRSRIKAVLTVDVSEKLSTITVPILYLRASQDRVVPHSSSKHISLLNARTRIVDIVAPHFLLQAVPAEAAQVVDNFIECAEMSSRFP